MGWLKKFTGRGNDREKWLESHPGKRPLSVGPEQSPEEVAKIRARMEQELEAQRNSRGAQ